MGYWCNSHVITFLTFITTTTEAIHLKEFDAFRLWWEKISPITLGSASYDSTPNSENRRQWNIGKTYCEWICSAATEFCLIHFSSSWIVWVIIIFTIGSMRREENLKRMLVVTNEHIKIFFFEHLTYLLLLTV